MKHVFERELARMGLPTSSASPEPVTEADLAPLPMPAWRMMRFHAVEGRPRDWSISGHLQGRFRTGPDASWQEITAQQYNSALPEPARIFYMTLRFFGVPVLGRDTYLQGKGRLLVRPLDLFTVQDGQGSPFDKGELVTWLNDALLMAPSMLLHPQVTWSEVDDHSFRVGLMDHGHRVEARVFVDGQGAVTDFHTDDRWYAPPGSKDPPIRTLWTTPVEDWQLVDGRMLPTRAQAVWRPQGEDPLPYGDFHFAPGMLAFNVPPPTELAAAAA